MAGIVKVFERNGSSPGVETEITNALLPMGSVDATGLDIATYPIVGGQRSFEKWLRLRVDSLGGASQIDNLKVFLTSIGAGWATGEQLLGGLTSDELTYTAATYPVGGPTSSASTVATLAVPEVEPEQANVGIGGLLSGFFTTPLPAYSDYIVLQLVTANTMPSGDVTPKVLVLQWDET